VISGLIPHLHESSSALEMAASIIKQLYIVG